MTLFQSFIKVNTMMNFRILGYIIIGVGGFLSAEGVDHLSVLTVATGITLASIGGLLVWRS